MEYSLGVDEMMVDLRSTTRWDMRFIKEYQALNNKNHDFECICAMFSYNPHLEKKASDEEDWDAFKNYIADDFKKLKFPPCHLYVGRYDVSATWFTPDVLLIHGLGFIEKQLIMKNMEDQLMELKLCKLEELVASEGDREVEEEIYLEYFRKKRFIGALLSKDIKNPIVISTKGDA